MKANKPFPAAIGVAVVLLGWLTQPAFSYGQRGAAERAIAYSAYVLEEIYDTDQYSIAIGCTPGTSGGRDNMRTGKPRRCTFGEFCEYLWMETKPGDQKPTKVNWGNADADLNPADKTKNTAEDLVRRIMSHITVPNPDYDPKGTKKQKKKLLRGGDIPGQGFQGNADGAKLGLPSGMTPAKDNIVNWYAALEHCSQRITDAKEEFDKMSSDERKRLGLKEDIFNKWVGTAKDGSELLYDLRQSDHWRYMYGEGELDKKMGVKTEYEHRSSRFGLLNNVDWKEMHTGRTIDLFDGGDDIKLKTKNFDAKWNVIASDAKFVDHMTAMAAVKRIKSQLAGC
ncbi:hypothetical protein QBC37DRAFT_487124 [Rhypophila decipiens]|uniref:Uncharacterized protein n=1 Tax=Rhypophila decipiens TaxID=261697 RepID=A0AAN6XYF9_9PEZI|nr:hypothetical protein QBC37DRAFT_487124 [Rhypophila decipiens]